MKNTQKKMSLERGEQNKRVMVRKKEDKNLQEGEYKAF